MRILIITPSAGGHHFEYKALLDKAFCELGHEVMHFSPNIDKSKSTESSNQLKSKKPKSISKIRSLCFFLCSEIWKNREKSLSNWNALFTHVKNLKQDSIFPDLLFFEYIDSSIGSYVANWEIEKKMTIPFSGILFQPQDTRLLNKSSLRLGPIDPYHNLKSKWCRKIGVLMEDAIPFMSEIIKKPVIEIPDIVSIATTLQDNSFGEHIQTLACERFVIGIWGSLEHRKGVTDFLQLSLKLPEDRYFFVMGGRIEYNGWTENDKIILQQSTANERKNLLITDQYLSNDQLISGMQSCDLIFAAYTKWRFTSGIVGKAAAVKVPILVNDGFVMAKRVTNFEIGFVKNEDKDIVEWLNENIQTIKNFKKSPVFIDGCLKYCERYGYEQWRKSLAQLIDNIES